MKPLTDEASRLFSSCLEGRAAIQDSRSPRRQRVEAFGQLAATRDVAYSTWLPRRLPRVISEVEG